jgi:hypothetical protein
MPDKIIAGTRASKGGLFLEDNTSKRDCREFEGIRI